MGAHKDTCCPSPWTRAFRVNVHVLSESMDPCYPSQWARAVRVHGPVLSESCWALTQPRRTRVRDSDSSRAPGPPEPCVPARALTCTPETRISGPHPGDSDFQSSHRRLGFAVLTPETRISGRMPTRTRGPGQVPVLRNRKRAFVFFESPLDTFGPGAARALKRPLARAGKRTRARAHARTHARTHAHTHARTHARTHTEAGRRADAGRPASRCGLVHRSSLARARKHVRARVC